MRTERPTILQIVPELDTGGAELSTIEICEAISQAGGRALVASEGGRLAARVAAVGGEFIPFPAASKNPVRILINAVKLRQLIQEKAIDLVHARSRAPAWSGYLAAQRCKIPFIATYHGAYGERTALKKRYNQVMVSGALTIANSNYTANLIKSRYGTRDEKLRVIYRGIDAAKFDPENVSEQRRTALRQAWNIAPDTRVILLIARLSPIKGQSVVIEAAKLLAASGELENATVVFAGDAQGRDGYVQHLKSAIAAAGLQDSILMPGHVEDVPAALSLAHTALFTTTKPETFGRTVIEAQAMGCPVVAVNIGAPPETVLAEPAVSDDERTGWLITPNDPKRLAQAIKMSLNLSSAERSAMGNRARQHVLARFTLDRMRRDTLSAYDDVLKSRLVSAWDQHQTKMPHIDTPV